MSADEKRKTYGTAEQKNVEQRSGSGETEDCSEAEQKSAQKKEPPKLIETHSRSTLHRQHNVETTPGQQGTSASMLERLIDSPPIGCRADASGSSSQPAIPPSDRLSKLFNRAASAASAAVPASAEVPASPVSAASVPQTSGVKRMDINRLRANAPSPKKMAKIMPKVSEASRSEEEDRLLEIYDESQKRIVKTIENHLLSDTLKSVIPIVVINLTVEDVLVEIKEKDDSCKKKQDIDLIPIEFQKLYLKDNLSTGDYVSDKLRENRDKDKRSKITQVASKTASASGSKDSEKPGNYYSEAVNKLILVIQDVKTNKELVELTKPKEQKNLKKTTLSPQKSVQTSQTIGKFFDSMLIYLDEVCKTMQSSLHMQDNPKDNLLVKCAYLIKTQKQKSPKKGEVSKKIIDLEHQIFPSTLMGNEIKYIHYDDPVMLEQIVTINKIVIKTIYTRSLFSLKLVKHFIQIFSKYMMRKDGQPCQMITKEMIKSIHNEFVKSAVESYLDEYQEANASLTEHIKDITVDTSVSATQLQFIVPSNMDQKQKSFKETEKTNDEVEDSIKTELKNVEEKSLDKTQNNPPTKHNFRHKSQFLKQSNVSYTSQDEQSSSSRDLQTKKLSASAESKTKASSSIPLTSRYKPTNLSKKDLSLSGPDKTKPKPLQILPRKSISNKPVLPKIPERKSITSPLTGCIRGSPGSSLKSQGTNTHTITTTKRQPGVERCKTLPYKSKSTSPASKTGQTNILSSTKEPRSEEKVNAMGEFEKNKVKVIDTVKEHLKSLSLKTVIPIIMINRTLDEKVLLQIPERKDPFEQKLDGIPAIIISETDKNASQQIPEIKDPSKQNVDVNEIPIKFQQLTIQDFKFRTEKEIMKSLENPNIFEQMKSLIEEAAPPSNKTVKKTDEASASSKDAASDGHYYFETVSNVLKNFNGNEIISINFSTSTKSSCAPKPQMDSLSEFFVDMLKNLDKICKDMFTTTHTREDLHGSIVLECAEIIETKQQQFYKADPDAESDFVLLREQKLGNIFPFLLGAPQVQFLKCKALVTLERIVTINRILVKMMFIGSLSNVSLLKEFVETFSKIVGDTASFTKDMIKEIHDKFVTIAVEFYVKELQKTFEDKLKVVQKNKVENHVSKKQLELISNDVEIFLNEHGLFVILDFILNPFIKYLLEEKKAITMDHNKMLPNKSGESSRKFQASSSKNVEQKNEETDPKSTAEQPDYMSDEYVAKLCKTDFYSRPIDSQDKESTNSENDSPEEGPSTSTGVTKKKSSSKGFKSEKERLRAKYVRKFDLQKEEVVAESLTRKMRLQEVHDFIGPDVRIVPVERETTPELPVVLITSDEGEVSKIDYSETDENIRLSRSFIEIEKSANVYELVNNPRLSEEKRIRYIDDFRQTILSKTIKKNCMTNEVIELLKHYKPNAPPSNTSFEHEDTEESANDPMNRIEQFYVNILRAIMLCVPLPQNSSSGGSSPLSLSDDSSQRPGQIPTASEIQVNEFKGRISKIFEQLNGNIRRICLDTVTNIHLREETNEEKQSPVKRKRVSNDSNNVLVPLNGGLREIFPGMTGFANVKFIHSSHPVIFELIALINKIIWKFTSTRTKNWTFVLDKFKLIFIKHIKEESVLTLEMLRFIYEDVLKCATEFHAKEIAGLYEKKVERHSPIRAENFLKRSELDLIDAEVLKLFNVYGLAVLVDFMENPFIKYLINNHIKITEKDMQYYYINREVIMHVMTVRDVNV